ncbi:toprim domain-containing protein [Candidatus Woesearchaeota archaeon]|nr:toprim domain-containing protein [Candidatus Woesearchaeota archaeon]
MHLWLESLKSSDKLIIVEGNKDRNSLESLGIKNIITINKPIFRLVEEISVNNKGVIILTDLDKHGKKLYNILRHNLQRTGVKVDNKFREFLYNNTKLSNIEGLVKYMKNREEPLFIEDF